MTELERVSAVAVVTARENYRLMAVEKQGIWGLEKYETAGIELITVIQHEDG